MRKIGEAIGWAAGVAVAWWRPALGVASCCLLLRGLELVSHPAALCVAGIAGLGLAARSTRRRRT